MNIFMAIVVNVIGPVVATTAVVGLCVAVWNDFVEMILS